MSKKVELRQAENNIFIEGVLSEKNLEIKKNRTGQDCIMGELIIKTSENALHKVKVYSNKLKKDGGENSIYKGLVTVNEQYKSIAEVGEKEADKVRISGAQLEINDYEGRDGTIVTFPQIKTNFINRMKSTEEYNPKAEFSIEMVVSKKIMEVDKDGEETGRLKLTGITPLYDGKVAPFDFVVSKQGSDWVDSNYEINDTVKVWGNLINSTVTTEKRETAGFGEDKVSTFTTTVNEMLITGGSEPYDEESPHAYKVENIKKALVERESMLEEILNKPKTPTNNHGSFGNNISTTEDLPF